MSSLCIRQKGTCGTPHITLILVPPITPRLESRWFRFALRIILLLLLLFLRIPLSSFQHRSKTLTIVIVVIVACFSLQVTYENVNTAIITNNLHYANANTTIKVAAYYLHNRPDKLSNWSRVDVTTKMAGKCLCVGWEGVVRVCIDSSHRSDLGMTVT